MTDDPMRQADIQRRPANMAKAPRCGAKTRAGHSCRQAAVWGRARCRMHGGATGSGGPRRTTGMGGSQKFAGSCNELWEQYARARHGVLLGLR
jgi:hypothetical protein